MNHLPTGIRIAHILRVYTSWSKKNHEITMKLLGRSRMWAALTGMSALKLKPKKISPQDHETREQDKNRIQCFSFLIVSSLVVIVIGLSLWFTKYQSFRNYVNSFESGQTSSFYIKIEYIGTEGIGNVTILNRECSSPS